MKNVALALALLFLMFTGCYRSPQKVNVDRQIEWAYHLIDQGEYSAAIDLFTQLSRQNNSPTVRIGLASAYAARAGVRVHSYWDLALPSVRVPPPTSLEANLAFRKQWMDRLQLLPLNLQNQVATKTEEIIAAHEKVETLKWRFQQIPLIVRIEQRNDIMMAREIIRDIPNRGIHLYRALLTLVLVRFETQVISNSIDETLVTKSGWPCSNSLRSWIHQLPPSLDLLADVLFDLKLAFPQKVAEMAPFEQDLVSFKQRFMNSQSILENTLCSAQ
ncbi:MAG: hypothetical protein RJB66_989 [Pseudomonadota bacterium]|jgi:hypothetical protein